VVAGAKGFAFGVKAGERAGGRTGGGEKKLFERGKNGFCGPRLTARLCQEENIHDSKKLVIELLRQPFELLRQSSLP